MSLAIGRLDPNDAWLVIFYCRWPVLRVGIPDRARTNRDVDARVFRSGETPFQWGARAQSSMGAVEERDTFRYYLQIYWCEYSYAITTMYRDDLLEYRRSVYQVAESVVLTHPGYLLVIFSGFNIQPPRRKSRIA